MSEQGRATRVQRVAACHLRELTTFKALQTLTLPSQGHQKALKKGPEGLRGHVFRDNSNLDMAA